MLPCAGEKLERSWLHVSSSLNCGKMAALEQLLQTWHDERDSKVRLCAPSCEIVDSRDSSSACAYMSCSSSKNTCRRLRQNMLCIVIAAEELVVYEWRNGGGETKVAPAQVLLFCHSMKMLNIIEQLILRAGYNFARLDGSTRQQEPPGAVRTSSTPPPPPSSSSSPPLLAAWA